MKPSKYAKAPPGKIAREIKQYLKWLRKELVCRPISVDDTIEMLEQAQKLLEGTMGNTQYKVTILWNGHWFPHPVPMDCEKDALRHAKENVGRTGTRAKVQRIDTITTTLYEIGENHG